MPLSSSLEKLEKEITDELKKLGLPVYFRIIRYDSEKEALEHSIGYYDVVSKEIVLKVWEIIGKHYDKWRKESLKEF